MREVLVMASLPEREWLPLALLWSRCHDIGLAIAVQFCAVFRRQAGMNGRRSDCPTTGSPHIPAMRKLPVVLFVAYFRYCRNRQIRNIVLPSRLDTRDVRPIVTT